MILKKERRVLVFNISRVVMTTLPEIGFRRREDQVRSGNGHSGTVKAGTNSNSCSMVTLHNQYEIQNIKSNFSDTLQ